MEIQERRRRKLFGIRIPGDPVTKGRPRATIVNGSPSLYTPAKTKQAEKLLAQEFMARRVIPSTPYTFEVAVHLDFFTKTAHRRDIDNYAKLVLDSANGLIWDDDAQVLELSCRIWRKDERPRTEFTVWALI